jgi:hypothetical protein
MFYSLFGTFAVLAQRFDRLTFDHSDGTTSATRCLREAAHLCSPSIRLRTEWSPLLIGDIYQNAGFLATFGSFTSLALRSCYYVFTTFDLGEIGGTEIRL